MSKLFRGGVAVEFDTETNASPMQTAAAVEALLKQGAEAVRQQFGDAVKVSVQTAFVRPTGPRKPAVAPTPAASAQVDVEDVTKGAAHPDQLAQAAE